MTDRRRAGELAAADATLDALAGWVRGDCLWSSAMAAALHFRPCAIVRRSSDEAPGRWAGRLPASRWPAVTSSPKWPAASMAAGSSSTASAKSAQRQRLEVRVDTRTRELADALASLHQDPTRSAAALRRHQPRGCVRPPPSFRGGAEITLRGRDKPASEYKGALSRIVSTRASSVRSSTTCWRWRAATSICFWCEPVDLDELAAEALAQAGDRGFRQGVRLGEPPGAPATMWSRAIAEAEPLLGVLLDNATRYSRAGDRSTSSSRPSRPSCG